MIILTGGAGFIGSCFLGKLNREGIKDILVVDRLRSADKWKNLIQKKFLNLISPEELSEMIRSKTLRDVTAIVHLGACTKTTERDAEYLYRNNVVFSKSLAEYSLEKDIRFVYASSAATYGNGELGYDDETFGNLRPLNMYGFSKHFFDSWIRESGKIDKVVGLKFFNVYGPNEYHKEDMASMVFKSYKQAITGSVKLFRSTVSTLENGEQERDFVYVKDVEKVLWHFLNAKSAGIFNLGSGVATTWNSLVGSVFKAVGKTTRIEYIEMPVEIKSQYQNFTRANSSKLVSELGDDFRFTSVEDGVEDYVKNHLSMTNSYY